MNVTRRSSLAFAGSALALLPALSLSRQAQAQAVVAGDAYSVALSDGRLSIWTRLIDAGGLQSYARAANPFTVFPISDAGFASFPNVVRDLLGYQSLSGSHNDSAVFPDTSKIVQLVRSHVVRGMHMPAEAQNRSMSVTTVAGTQITVDGTKAPAQITWASALLGKTLTALLVDQPIVCTNAVMYVIDRVDVAEVT